MKSQLEQHVRSALHAKSKELSSSKQQVLLAHIQQSSASRNKFFKDMCNWMVSVNIPWFKLQMPKFRSFWGKYYKQHIPDQLTLRKHYLLICYEETLENIRGNVKMLLQGLLWTKQWILWVALSQTLWLAIKH
jgi:hypothetical protein